MMIEMMDVYKCTHIMTPDQKRAIESIALKLKQLMPDFMGSITFNLSNKMDDVKVEVKECLNIKS